MYRNIAEGIELLKKTYRKKKMNIDERGFNVFFFF